MTKRIGTDERGMRTEGQRRAAKKLKQRRPVKGAKKFDPNRTYVENAVSEYLKRGGKIKRVVLNDKAFNNFLSSPNFPSSVDDFLKGD